MVGEGLHLHYCNASVQHTQPLEKLKLPAFKTIRQADANSIQAIRKANASRIQSVQEMLMLIAFTATKKVNVSSIQGYLIC